MRDHIAGILVFSSGYFPQGLEGGRGAVNKTFCKIVNDQRHFNISILTYNEVSERSFPFWTMAFAFETDVKKEIYFKLRYG
ncbi:MAG: BLUF domain-containing protein [Oligoflexales bacterium]